MATSAALAAPPGDLGVFASAVEAQPVLTLTATGILVGASFGALTGYLAAKLFRQDACLWAMQSGGVFGAMLGLKSFQEGRNLEAWLASSQQ